MLVYNQFEKSEQYYKVCKLEKERIRPLLNTAKIKKILYKCVEIKKPFLVSLEEEHNCQSFENINRKRFLPKNALHSLISFQKDFNL